MKKLKYLPFFLIFFFFIFKPHSAFAYWEWTGWAWICKEGAANCVNKCDTNLMKNKDNATETFFPITDEKFMMLNKDKTNTDGGCGGYENEDACSDTQWCKLKQTNEDGRFYEDGDADFSCGGSRSYLHPMRSEIGRYAPPSAAENSEEGFWWLCADNEGDLNAKRGDYSWDPGWETPDNDNDNYLDCFSFNHSHNQEKNLKTWWMWIEPPANQPPDCTNLSMTNTGEGDNQKLLTATISDPEGQLQKTTFHYTTDTGDFCNASWQKISDPNESDNQVTWDISNLNPGTYTVIANVFDQKNLWCTGNPGGHCNTATTACTACSNSLSLELEQNFVCENLEYSPVKEEYQFGDEIELVCKHNSLNVSYNASNVYDFRYFITEEGNTQTVEFATDIAEDSDNLGQSVPATLTVPSIAGEYVVQCRACATEGFPLCTDWGKAGGWNTESDN